MKIGNFATIKKGLCMWFLFGPLIQSCSKWKTKKKPTLYIWVFLFQKYGKFWRQFTISSSINLLFLKSGSIKLFFPFPIEEPTDAVVIENARFNGEQDKSKILYIFDQNQFFNKEKNHREYYHQPSLYSLYYTIPVQRFYPFFIIIAYKNKII